MLGNKAGYSRVNGTSKYPVYVVMLLVFKLTDEHDTRLAGCRRLYESLHARKFELSPGVAPTPHVRVVGTIFGVHVLICFACFLFGALVFDTKIRSGRRLCGRERNCVTPLLTGHESCE